MLERLLRIARKPPHVIAHRARQEALSIIDRWRLPRRARAFDVNALLSACAAPDIDTLWQRLRVAPYATYMPRESDAATMGEHERARVRMAATRAARHEVDLLGSGPVDLGPRIDWHTDFKSGLAFPDTHARAIDYADLCRPSDVKVPWELSRLQWALPLGQAWTLDRDDRWASAARDIIEQWIDANPVGRGPAWAIAMEAAMRIFTWTWLFHALGDAPSWRDPSFRVRFLRTLFLHGEHVHDYREWSDVNGNHCTADAAALVFAGLFFGAGRAPKRWADTGWRLLCEEMPRQVLDDGVDFEGSVPYHRLVLELFLLPALYRKAQGLDVPETYASRLRAMDGFTRAYMRSDGSSPWLGDADDGRALPLGGQAIDDHRYLTQIVSDAFGGAAPLEHEPSEVLWVLGPRARQASPSAPLPSSSAFPTGGVYIMRNARDHVLIDASPVGMAGRGGHGHNDCLAFDAMLDGVHLISDRGTFVYTASALERNRFRSTASHNTPQVDGAEINRLDEAALWTLGRDAEPHIDVWSTSEARDVFEGRHTGYHRLPSPVTPVRRITLEHATHTLMVEDRFEGSGPHRVDVHLYLAPGVPVESLGDRAVRLARRFVARFEGDGWRLHIAPTRVSPSYGTARDSYLLHLTHEGELAALRITIRPEPENRSIDEGIRNDRT
ncbi:MAG: hypothetical protein EB084_13815 [Proteobacteria bacterium]|nr:hypothetical protein [Pseudomonadota bacterium]